MTIHKANYKQKVRIYMGFGGYEMIPTTLCRGYKGFHSEYPPRGRQARNWKHVTCKNCLKKKEL